MNTSTNIDLIATALLAASGTFPTLKKTGENPHFRSTYVTLEGLLEAVTGGLHRHGITILQGCEDADDGGMTVVTRLLHVSGQWIEGGVRLPLEKPTPQAAGSALSYGRRYGLEAILGLTGTADDDANTAEVHSMNKAKDYQPRPSKVVERKVGPPVEERPVPTQPRPTHIEYGPGTATTTVPACPVCDGKMWDNREGKKNPKAPDYKCRDKTCDGLYWPGDWPPKDAVPAGPAFDEVPEGLQDEDDRPLPF